MANALVIFQEVAAERRLYFEENILTQLASGFAGDQPSSLVIHGGPGTGKVRLLFVCTTANIPLTEFFTRPQQHIYAPRFISAFFLGEKSQSTNPS